MVEKDVDVDPEYLINYYCPWCETKAVITIADEEGEFLNLGECMEFNMDTVECGQCGEVMLLVSGGKTDG